MPRRYGKKPLLQHIQTSGGSLWLHLRNAHRRTVLEMRIACWAKYSESPARSQEDRAGDAHRLLG